MCRRVSLLRKPAVHVFRLKISSHGRRRRIQNENFECGRAAARVGIAAKFMPPAGLKGPKAFF
jgi:hypothetical protein